MEKKTVKFSRETKSRIFQEARRRVGGFGMWIEIGERFNMNTNEIYTNRLLKLDEESDLSDFISWSDFCKVNFTLVNGHTMLDIYVHDSEELKDNMEVLLDENGKLIKSWVVGEYKERDDFVKNYREK